MKAQESRFERCDQRDRQNRFADQAAWADFLEHAFSPRMVKVALANERDHWSGIEDNRPHLPKSSKYFLFVERSVCVPLPIPQKSFTRSASEGPSVDSGGCSGRGLNIVSKARALAGSVSSPAGRTDPFSNSTSTVL